MLTIYGDTGTLRIPTPDDGVSAMAFVTLEDDRWSVTGGPMTFEPPPVETEPPVRGTAILDHEIGRLALEYASRLEAGDLGAAIELLSGPARAKRAAESAAERKESDEFRRRHMPTAAAFAEQIRSGGQLTFAGERAYLNVVTSESSTNADGSSTFTSTTTSLPFELQDGTWRIAH
ncbi:MAG TPA: hypothetical protein VNB06_03120 [Thermoanaerobaculia bacterium]|nr:hypothetical protein [Thermoanaerobaculia bacterium]